ncbi:hypothetical protein P153DRAFT_366400 [Dothidotthia symphoricarpi CBS 119687]|uniref:Uncharacterized protein n=1 Tax=Dothidotthia symphoricarpi CBS 119687 TaxID=1392245 RepID=A0A6A6AHJ9_9PLEO|nr:uncharacterized protein P153DRAFT_366400 [Dothidotthia symphoricarpi CBS 119687]KAF2129901.1 hypothetical protein P153DRAFT_366400 [Dothidotthia symphoricarpi CBS 119687]
MCSANEATKILRKEVHDCPLAATRTLVHGLHKDTGLLLCIYLSILSFYCSMLTWAAGKYTTGDTLRGPQGETIRGGEFALYDFKRPTNNPSEAEDDMRSLNRTDFAPPRGPRVDESNPPRGPRVDRGVERGLYKYPRTESMGWPVERPIESLSYENDRLNYDE